MIDILKIIQFCGVSEEGGEKRENETVLDGD